MNIDPNDPRMQALLKAWKSNQSRRKASESVKLDFVRFLLGKSSKIGDLIDGRIDNFGSVEEAVEYMRKYESEILSNERYRRLIEAIEGLPEEEEGGE